MAIRLIYESGINGETTDITGYLPLYSYDMTEHAEEGSVALSSVTLDDPNGELDIVGWRRFWAYEDTATGSNSLMHYGWIGEKTVNRGTSRTGSGRLWTVSVADQNVVLGFRVLTAAQVNRPAETDVQRVNWLMGFVDWFGRAPITVDEFTFDANAVQMDAVDYRGQTALDILSDCANQSGKNFYCYTKDNGYPASQPTRGIWYGSMAHTAYSSPLRLTNVAANVDNVLTFAISENTQLERKADRVYSGAYVRYDGGAVYEQNATTFNNFTQRDAVVEASNVKSSGAATRRANRYLADLNSEEDRITTSFYVPAAKVNFVKPGMRIQFQASHLPGYEVFNWLRVASKQVAEVSEIESAGELKYLVTLVLMQNSPAQTVVPPVEVGEGVMYAYADNTAGVAGPVEVYVNGNQVVGAYDDTSVAIVVDDGFLQSGDNVVAAKISNGTGSEYWWGGNGTGWEMRIFNSSGNLLAYTTSAAKILPLENFHAGVLNAEPANWKTAAFDDSAWASAEDVTGSLNSLGAEMFPDPVPPARTIAPVGAKVESFTDPSYAYLLVWLVRVNFTV